MIVGRRAIGFARAEAAPAPSLLALVDILLATIGIFVIVFALQEVRDLERLEPAPVDAVTICDDAARVILHRPDGSWTTIDITAPAESFATAFEGGGRFLVAIAAGCATAKGSDGHSVAGTLAARAEALAALPDDGGEALHRFEFAPLGEPPHDARTILARWRSETEVMP